MILPRMNDVFNNISKEQMLSGGGHLASLIAMSQYWDYDLFNEILEKEHLAEQVIANDERLFARIYLQQFKQPLSADEDGFNTEIATIWSATQHLLTHASEDMIKILRPHILFASVVLTGHQTDLKTKRVTAKDIRKMEDLSCVLFEDVRHVLNQSDWGTDMNTHAFHQTHAYWLKIKIAYGAEEFNHSTIEALSQDPTVGMSILRSCFLKEGFWEINDEKQSELAFNIIKRTQELFKPKINEYHFNDGHYWNGGSPQVDLIKASGGDINNVNAQIYGMNQRLRHYHGDDHKDLFYAKGYKHYNLWADELVKIIANMCRDNLDFCSHLIDLIVNEQAMDEGRFILNIFNSYQMPTDAWSTMTQRIVDAIAPKEIDAKTMTLLSELFSRQMEAIISHTSINHPVSHLLKEGINRGIASLELLGGTRVGDRIRGNINKNLPINPDLIRIYVFKYLEALNAFNYVNDFVVSSSYVDKLITYASQTELSTNNFRILSAVEQLGDKAPRLWREITEFHSLIMKAIEPNDESISIMQDAMKSIFGDKQYLMIDGHEKPEISDIIEAVQKSEANVEMKCHSSQHNDKKSLIRMP